MTTDPRGWPDPARPGYPTHPERDGWHWIKPARGIGITSPRLWHARIARWEMLDGTLSFTSEAVEMWRYLGPCLTPAEVAAAVQAEREACADVAYRIYDDSATAGEDEAAQGAYDVARTIENRGPADALVEAQKAAYREGWNDRESDFLAGVDRTGMHVVSAEALAQARREGMEAAARIAHAAHGEEGACRETIRMVERAIRSAAGEVGK